MNQTGFQHFCLVEKHPTAVYGIDSSLRKSEVKGSLLSTMSDSNERGRTTSTMTKFATIHMADDQEMPHPQTGLPTQQEETNPRVEQQVEEETCCCCFVKKSKRKETRIKQKGSMNESSITDPLISKKTQKPCYLD